VQFHFASFDGVEELDLVGPWEFVGILAQQGHCAPPKLTTLNSMNPTGAHGMRFSADFHFATAPLPDILVVPGGGGSRAAMTDPAVLAYLQRCARESSAILSICTGSYLMQAAGLLAGRQAVTHWTRRQHLRDDPSITLEGKRFVHDGKIWSAAGVSAGMDMMLAFIANRWGEDIAGDVQLHAEYYPDGTIYGDPSAAPDLPDYIQQLARPRSTNPE
jgi:cyclohexyl-isocyanide hydratase